MIARTASRTVATPRPPSLAFIDVGTESKWLRSATVPLLLVPGMRAITLRNRPAKTWLKSLRVAMPSTTCDSTPRAVRLALMVSSDSLCAFEPMGRGVDATASSCVMARSAEKTFAGAFAVFTDGVWVSGR